MLDGSILRLPRNFAFFQRLPARFMLTVLSEGNAKGDGARWYKVQIGDQILNIISKAKLKAGDKLLIEKQADLNLKIVKEAQSAIQGGAKASKEGLAEVGQALFRGEMVQADTNQLFAWGEWLNILSILLFEQQDLETQVEQVGRQVRFELPIFFNDKIAKTEGVFILQAKGDWHLFMALPDEMGNINVDEIENELVDYLVGLPISSIKIANVENLKILKGGIDLHS